MPGIVKTLVIGISVALVFACATFGVLTVLSPAKDSDQAVTRQDIPISADNTSKANEIPEVQVTSTDGATSTSTSDVSNSQKEPDDNGTTVSKTVDQNVQDNHGETSNISEQELLKKIDVEACEKDAAEFLSKILTYNASTINTPGYVLSWNPYIMAGNEKSGLLDYYTNQQWRWAMSSYPEVYSKVVEIKSSKHYLLREPTGTIFTVRVVMIHDCNQGDPGELEWMTVNSYDDQYEVYFNTNGKIIGFEHRYGTIIASNIPIS